MNSNRNGVEEQVTLVDNDDRVVGADEKLAAHLQGKLHRAFSVFVFNSRGELLLQKRAQSKYHSGGLWSNTCCGHPRPGESVEDAAVRRLSEEMGFRCELRPVFSFVYRVTLENGLTEHEFDHVLAGSFDAMPSPDPSEVEEWKWLALSSLSQELSVEPARYTYWLKLVMDHPEWPHMPARVRS